MVVTVPKNRRRRRRRTHCTTSQSIEINVVQPYEGKVDNTVVQDLTDQVKEENVREITRITWKMPSDKLFYVRLLGKNKFFPIIFS